MFEDAMNCLRTTTEGCYMLAAWAIFHTAPDIPYTRSCGYDYHFLNYIQGPTTSQSPTPTGKYTTSNSSLTGKYATSHSSTADKHMNPHSPITVSIPRSPSASIKPSKYTTLNSPISGECSTSHSPAGNHTT